MTAALTFGGWLRRRRGGLGLTQKQLAQQVGYAEVTLRKVEADELRPSREMAARLAEALQIPPEEQALFVRFARDEMDPDIAALPNLELLGPIIENSRSQLGPPDSETVGQPPRLQLFAVSTKVDWGEAPDVGRFRGRQSELELLRRWLVDDQCRLVAVLGMGGIGKTALATQAASGVQEQFSVVIWRSLRNAPPLIELLSQCIQVLSSRNEYELPQTIVQRMAMLMEHLRGQRCLLVLDNFETVLQGERPGHYLPGYEGYGELLRQIAEGRHQSCLVLTSREKPRELIPLASASGPVRTLGVASLPAGDSRALLQDRGLRGSDQEWVALSERYSGNPLALQIVSETIHELFAGDIAQFLRQDTILFGGINDLLAQQFMRLTPLEQEVMFWLAVEREPVTLEELCGDIVPQPREQLVLGALHALRHRSLVERVQAGFTLQNVVLEYFTATLIEWVSEEIRSESVIFLQRYALLKATAKSYVRESQRNLILTPIAQRLVEELGLAGVEDRLSTILAHLRSTEPRPSGYAGGNILNLLVQLGIDLRGQDFSQLAVWQADLRNVTAQDVDFHQAELGQSAFTDTFSDIISVAFSPDGQRLAAGTKGGEIRMWQVSDGKPVLTWAAHSGWVWSVDFSPNGSILATSGGDAVVRLWDAQDGKHFATLRGHSQDVFCVRFSADDRALASSSLDHTVRLWELSSSRCVHLLQGHTTDVSSVCFTPDSNVLVSGSIDGTLRLWDRQTGANLDILQGPGSPVLSLCLSPNGDVLATASYDHLVRLWDMHTGKCLHQLQGHTDWVRSVCFSPDGGILASGSDDRSVRLWDPHSGECLAVLQGHTNWVRSVCFNPEGSVLASGGSDPAVRLWDRHTGRCLDVLQGHTNWVRSVCFSPDGSILASGSDDSTVRLWDRHTGQCLYTLHGHANWVRFVCFSPDGDILASGSDDPAVRLWDTHTGQCLQILQGPTNTVRSVCFSSDGDVLASCGGDPAVRIWDRYTGECLHILQGHTNSVRSICFSPDGRILASGSVDPTVRLWDRQTGESVHALPGHTNGVWAICFNPSGSILASAGDDSTIRLWDVHTGQCLHAFQGHTAAARSVCFSADGSVVASSSMDQTVRLWDVETGQCRFVLHGHTSPVKHVCFDPTGGTLATGGDDPVVMLWDTHTAERKHVLRGHTQDILSMCFSPDGAVLATGSADETLRLWDVQTGALLHTLRSDRPYERMIITGVTGVTPAQIAALRRLGAVDNVDITER